MTTFSPDVLVAGLQKVEEAQGSTFDLYHPAFTKVLDAQGTPPTLPSLYTEFGLVPVSPESITTVLHGTETIEQVGVGVGQEQQLRDSHDLRLRCSC